MPLSSGRHVLRPPAGRVIALIAAAVLLAAAIGLVVVEQAGSRTSGSVVAAPADPASLAAPGWTSTYFAAILQTSPTAGYPTMRATSTATAALVAGACSPS